MTVYLPYVQSDAWTIGTPPRLDAISAMYGLVTGFLPYVVQSDTSIIGTPPPLDTISPPCGFVTGRAGAQILS